MAVMIRRVFAWVALGYPVLLQIWGIALGLAVFDGETFFFAIPLILAAVTGWILTMRRPENRIGSVISLLAFGLVTSGVSSELARFALEANRHTEAAVAWIVSELGFMMFVVATLILLPLWFPTGDAPSPPWRWVGRVGVLFAVMAAASSMFANQVTIEPEGMAKVIVDNPAGWLARDFTDFLFVPTLLAAVGAIFALIVRWRQSHGIERLQMRWFGWSASFVLAAFVLTFEQLGIPTWIVNIGIIISLTILLISIAVAVLRYRLYDIDRLVSRTVTYSMVGLVLAATYFGAVTIVTSVVPTQNAIAVAASTLAVAAAFNPLRVRTQRLVDRKFNRSAYQSELVSEQFAARIREPLTVEQLTHLIQETAIESLEPGTSAIWLNPKYGQAPRP